MSTNSIDRGTKVGYMGNNDATGSDRPPRLDAGNYSTWKPAMDVYLQRHGAAGVHKESLTMDEWIIDSTDVSSWAQQSLSSARATARGIKPELDPADEPGVKAARATVTAHVERSQKAYGSIYSAMPEYLRLEITHNITQGWAFGLWGWLERKFQSTEADNVSTLLMKWVHLEQKPRESFDAYRARLNEVAALLKHAKEEISPSMYCLFLLERLQPIYTPVILALKNGTHLKDKSAVDWDAVTVLINAHERDVIRKQTEEAGMEAKAMSARTEVSHSGSGSQYSGNGGGRAKHRRARDPKNVTCYNCQQKGHYADKCDQPHKERDDKGDSKGTAASSAAGSKRVEQTSSVVVAKEFSFAVVVKQGLIKSETGVISHPRPPIRRNLNISNQLGNQLGVTSKKSGPEIPGPVSYSNLLTQIVPAAVCASKDAESDVKDSPVTTVNDVRTARIRRRRLKLKERRKLDKVLAATDNTSPSSNANEKDVGIDSMASVNVNGNKLNFIPGSLKPCEPFSVLVADNGEVEVSMVGSIELNINIAIGQTVTFVVNDVYYHPRFGANLLSLNWLTEHGWKFYSDKKESFLLTPKEQLKIHLSKEKRVCILRCVRGQKKNRSDQVYQIGDIQWDSASDLQRLHEKLGHMGFDRMLRILKQDATDGIGKLKVSADVLKEARKRVLECRACTRGKGTRTAFGHRGIDKGSAPGETLHMDTFYIKYQKMDGTPHIEYGLTVSDPYTTFKWYQCLQSKDLVAKAVTNIIKNAQTQFGCTVKRLLTDGGTEFINKTLRDFCLQEGIELHYPPARTPQLNSVAERSVRSCKDAGRTLLMHACLPGNFGSFAVQHAVYLWNRTNVAPSTGKTPYEVMKKKKPSLEHLSVFGCDAYYHVPKGQRDETFSEKMIPGIYLGHSHLRDGAFIWDLRSGDIVLTRDVEYLDRRFTHSAALRAGGEQLQAVISGVSYTRDNTPATGADAHAYVADINFDDISEDTETQDQHSGVWDVQCVTGKRSINGKIEYCVKWIGFEQETWEPAANVEDGAREAIEEFESMQEIQSDVPVFSPPSPDPIESAAVAAAPVPEIQVTDTIAPSALVVPAAANRRSARSHASSAALDAMTGQHLVHMALSAICSSLPGGDSCFSETDMQCFEAVSNGLQQVYAVSGGLALLEDRTPNTYKEAAASPDAAKWKAAMDKEMSGCEKMAVWEEVPRSSVSKWQVIPCKWVFKIKVNSNGEVNQHKARITPKGFMQLLGINYIETFAATGKYKSMRLGLSLSAGCDHELDQMDVPQAFLNADVDEDIYMELPEGYRDGKQHMVYKLKKSLYGLKQAPRNWYLLVSKFISEMLGYKATVSDPCLFFRRSRTGRLMLLFLFVDDFQSSYHMEDKSEWDELKQKLVDRFQTKDLGPSTWILGMRITRDRKLRTITLDQELYVTKALERYGMDQCTPVMTPGLCGSSIVVDKADSTHDQSADRQLFQEMIGSLMYAAISARPDIAHAVQQLARAMQNPTQSHMQAAKRVFRYLAGTKDIGMIFGSRNGDQPLDTRGRNSFRLDVCAFADADWANDKADRKSITGWVAKVNGDPISWASKKQRTVAQSTCEAELYAEAAAIQEVLWMRGILKELGLYVQTGSLIHGDNQSTIALSKNGVKGERTKHVDVKYHFITETVESGSVQLKWVPTTEQQADIFTKALPTPVFEHFRKALMTR
jgi:hypothetical protein